MAIMSSKTWKEPSQGFDYIYYFFARLLKKRRVIIYSFLLFGIFFKNQRETHIQTTDWFKKANQIRP